MRPPNVLSAPPIRTRAPLAHLGGRARRGARHRLLARRALRVAGAEARVVAVPVDARRRAAAREQQQGEQRRGGRGREGATLAAHRQRWRARFATGVVDGWRRRSKHRLLGAVLDRFYSR